MRKLVRNMHDHDIPEPTLPHSFFFLGSSSLHMDFLRTALIREMPDFSFAYATSGTDKASAWENIQKGLAYSNNDRCYPCQALTGTAIGCHDRLSGEEHLAALSLCVRCQACDYAHVIRKGLFEATGRRFEVSLIEDIIKGRHPALSEAVLHRCAQAVALADIVVQTVLATRPFESTPGSTASLAKRYRSMIKTRLGTARAPDAESLAASVIKGFSTLLDTGKQADLLRVGIGGIPSLVYDENLNGGLIHHLERERCAVSVPYLSDYVLYFVRKTFLGLESMDFFARSLEQQRTELGSVLTSCVGTHFPRSHERLLVAPRPYRDLREQGLSIVDVTVEEGVGWLNAAHALGYHDRSIRGVVIAQPFACLVGHMNTHAMRHVLQKRFPDIILVPLEYDPGTSETNQLNRVKLMIDRLRFER